MYVITEFDSIYWLRQNTYIFKKENENSRISDQRFHFFYLLDEMKRETKNLLPAFFGDKPKLR